MKCKKAISILLAITLAFSMAMPIFAADAAKIDGSNWMSAVDGSQKITEINMPGTHDSATRNNSATLISTTQSLSITEQLYAGVRYLDVRAKKTKNDYISVHDITNNKISYGIFSKDLTVGNIIDDCKEFLKNNPGETILFKLKEDSGDAGREFYTGFYEKYIENDAASWFIKNKIPTLDEVRGKIVLLRHTSFDPLCFDDENCGINFSYYPYIPEKEVGAFETRDITYSEHRVYLDEHKDTEYPEEWYELVSGIYAFAKMYVEDAYNLSAKKKIQAIEMFLDEDYDEDYYSYFKICNTNSSAGGYPEKNAVKINAFLSNYNFVEGKKYGVICMDFATEQLCEKVYMTNAGIMINEPNEPTTGESSYISFGFMGKLLKKINDFMLRLALLF